MTSSDTEYDSSIHVSTAVTVMTICSMLSRLHRSLNTQIRVTTATVTTVTMAAMVSLGQAPADDSAVVDWYACDRGYNSPVACHE